MNIFRKLSQSENKSKIIGVSIISILLGFFASIFFLLLIGKLFNTAFSFPYMPILFLFLLIVLSALLFIAQTKTLNNLSSKETQLNFIIYSILGVFCGILLIAWDFPNLTNIPVFTLLLGNTIFLYITKLSVSFVSFVIFYYLVLSIPFLKKHQHEILLLVISVLFTMLFFVNSYTFGFYNQTEDLPKVMRLLDENYLPNDYFVNQFATHISIRYVFVKTMAIIATLIGLRPAYLLVFFISTTFILFISACFTYQLFSKNLFAGIFSIILIWIIQNPYQLAGGYGIIYGQTLANFVCSVFLYWGFYQAIINRKFFFGGILFGIAFLFQALSAIQGFAILAAGLLAVDIAGVKQWFSWRFLNQTIRKYLPMVLVFIGLASLLMIPYLINSQGYLSSKEFAMIYGYFRIPHHARPSYFLTDIKIIETTLFILIFTHIILRSNALISKNWMKSFFTGASILIATLFVLAYIFVEIIPTRIFVTLVPYMKIGSMISWIGMVFIAGFFAELISNKKKIEKSSIIILCEIIFYFTFMFDRKIGFSLLILFILVFLYKAILNQRQNKNIANKRNENNFSYSGSLLVLILLFGFSLVKMLPYTMRPIAYSINKALREPEYSSDSLFGYIAENTEEDALFIAPDAVAADIRIGPKRAIVVAPKTYPANDEGLEEWYDRMLNVYGCSEGIINSDFSIYTVNNYYEYIDDACLSMLTNKYDADYAILFPNTETTYPVVFQEPNWKIVKLKQ